MLFVQELEKSLEACKNQEHGSPSPRVSRKDLSLAGPLILVKLLDFWTVELQYNKIVGF